MYNLDDEVVQKFKFGLLELPIHNRNILADDEKLGYEKRVKNDWLVSSGELGELQDSFSKKVYELSWKLLFSTEEIQLFFELINLYNSTIKLAVRSSFDLRSSSSLAELSTSKLILEDNRIKDYFTNEYCSYIINFTEVKEISFFNNGLFRIELMAEASYNNNASI